MKDVLLLPSTVLCGFLAFICCAMLWINAPQLNGEILQMLLGFAFLSILGTVCNIVLILKLIGERFK